MAVAAPVNPLKFAGIPVVSVPGIFAGGIRVNRLKTAGEVTVAIWFWLGTVVSRVKP